jgi:hypothetical protein
MQCLASSKILTPQCVPPAFGAGGGHTRCVERGWGVNSSEDARHCSVLFICKYFVPASKQNRQPKSSPPPLPNLTDTATNALWDSVGSPREAHDLEVYYTMHNE